MDRLKQSLSKNTTIDKITRRQTIGLLISIGLLSLVLRICFLEAMRFNDSYGYMRVASTLSENPQEFLRSGDKYDIYFGSRLAVVLPTALFIKLWGCNLYSSTLPGLISSVASIFAIFLLGKSLFNNRIIGLMAAFLFALFPLDVVMASQLLPDVIQPLFIALAILMIIRAHHFDCARPARLYFIAGVLFGISAYARVTGYGFAFLILLGYAFVNRTSLRWYPWLLLGGLLVEVSAMGIFAIQTGDPILRWHNLLKIRPADFMVSNMPLVYYAVTFFTKTTFYSYYFYAYLASVLFLIVSSTVRDKGVLIILIWMAAVFSFSEFAFNPFQDDYQLLIKNYRYTTVFVIPVILTIGYALVMVWKVKVFKPVVPCILLALGVSSVCSANELYKKYKKTNKQYKDVVSYINKQPQKPIYAIEPWSHRIEFLLNSYSRFLGFSMTKKDSGSPWLVHRIRGDHVRVQISQMHDVYLIEDDKRMKRYASKYGLRRPSYLNATREFYKIWTNLPRDAILLRRSREHAIYYLPEDAQFNVDYSNKQPMHDTDIIIDDYFSILGYDHYCRNDYARSRSLARHEFILYFHAYRNIPHDYQFILMVESIDIQKRQSLTKRDVYPTSFWRGGETIAYWQQIELPVGLHGFVLKLYVWKSKGKVKIRPDDTADVDNGIILGEMTVRCETSPKYRSTTNVDSATTSERIL